MMTTRTDSNGVWNQVGRSSWALVEPSQEYLDKRQRESEQDAQAEEQRQGEQKAALEALSQPLIDEIDAAFQRRSLPALTADEATAMRDRVVYLSSRGKHGKADG